MATNPNTIPGLFASSTSEANPTHCPLCNTPVAGSDGLQLHYLTSCESYDRLSNEQPRPKPTSVTPPTAQRNTFEDVQATPPSSQRNTFEDEQPRSMASATPPTSQRNTFERTSFTPANNSGADTGVATPPSGTSTVQFMWQPLTDIVYPEVMLLASFEPGSVSLKLDSDGGHYASSTVAIPNGTYEGQLVIGDSFIHPVKKFTVDNSNDIIALQFDVEQGKESPADSNLEVSTPTRFGTGHMQQNPSYSGGVSGVSSYSYDNPTYSGYSPLPQDVGHSGGDQGGSGGRYPMDISSGFGYYEGYRTAPNTSRTTVQPRVVRHTTTTTPSSTVPTTSHSWTTSHSTTTSARAADPLLKTTARQVDPPRRSTNINASSEPPPPRSTPISGIPATVDPPPRSTHITTSSEPPPQRTTQASSRPPTVDPLPRGAPSVSSTPQTKPVSKASTSKTTSRRSGHHGNREPVRSVSEFNVGELRKGEEFPPDMNVYRQLLEGVTTERDELKQNLERVNARWDGKVKRLEAQLARKSDTTAAGGDNTQALQEAQDQITILRQEVDTLRREKDTNNTSSGSAELEKELQELKDRNTALEHQLMEYAGTISDQSKYIRSQGVSQSSGELMAADQNLIHISAFAKKQQLEHAEALAELQTKISSTTDTMSNVQYTSMGISAQLEENRVQNERFMQDLARKDEEIRALKLGRGGSQNRFELELATLREKVSAYQEEFENLAPLRDEVEHLREQTAQQEEEIRRLTTDNQDLTSQFQTLLDSSEKADPDIVRKANDYDTLLERYHDLQQTRIGLENEVQPLREERASMLRENALMREGSNPESYTKLRLEHETLKARCEEVESVLAVNEDTNREMHTKLNDATNPDMLISIQSRMTRYKLERDQARKQIEAIEQQLAVSEVGRQEAIEKLQEATEQSERVINEFQQNVTRLEEEQSRTEDKIYRYREERNLSRKKCKDIEKQLADWKGLLLKSAHFASSDHDDQSDTASYSSPYPPSDQTGSPTSDYHPQAYTDDHHFRPEDPSELETELATLNMEPSKAHRKRTTSGSRAKLYKESSSFEFVDVKTKEGSKVMNIGRPRGLNAKNKPRVVIKRGEEFEQGTLMFVGEVNGKELAGIQMDCRVSKPSGSGASSSGDNDGTYKNGKRYFKSPMGYALYVPVSKVFVEMESAYV